MAEKTLLILGGTGLLGPHIHKIFSPAWTVHSVSRHASPLACDITRPADIRAALEKLTPDAVIHLAALTDVEKCEQHPEQADALNHLGVRNVVEALSHGTPFVYISTDHVYPDTTGAHAEGDEAPVNVYAKTKLAGEKAALEHPKALVLRTNFFGHSLTEGRESLSDFFIKSFKNQAPIQIYENSFFSPLHMESLVELIKECLEKGITGLYNAGSRDGMSKAEFARRIAGHYALDTACATSVDARQVQGRTPRPHDLRMDVSKIEKVLGRKMPSLEKEIQKL